MASRLRLLLIENSQSLVHDLLGRVLAMFWFEIVKLPNGQSGGGHA